MLTSFLFRSHSIIKTRHQPTLLDTCPDENVEWTHVSCGVGHSAALTKEGEVYTWGSNNGGQLGHGDEMFRCNMRESIERVVEVPNCSKAAFLQVIEYLCLDGFTVSISDVIELWQLADMYQLNGIKYTCMGAMERDLSKEDAFRILQKAEKLNCPCDELERIYLKFQRREVSLKIQFGVRLKDGDELQ